MNPKNQSFDVGRALCQVIAVALLIAAIVLIVLLAGPISPPGKITGDVRHHPEKEIVAVLDEPLDANHNVIWCGTFNLAWNGLKPYNGGGPIAMLSPNDLLRDVGGKCFVTG